MSTVTEIETAIEKLSVADERPARVLVAHKKIVATRLADYRSGKSVPIPHADLMRKLRAK